MFPSNKFNINDHIDKLTPAKKKGKYICPACNGHNLSINSTTGKYNCWNCGDTQKIKDILTAGSRPLPPKKSPREKKTSYFNYPDRQGNPLIRVVRIDDGQGKKQIFQQHWDGQNWVAGYGSVKTTDIPLYRYSEVINAIAVIRENRQTDDTFYDPRYLNETARAIVEAQPGTVLIYPLVLEDKLWILWTTAGNVAGSKEISVSQQQLGNMVVKFRALLDNPNSNLQELQATAQQLYQWLIQPIESELRENQIERLVFAQDRVTRYIPMAALHDGEQYLIQRYTIHSILSAQLTDMNDKLSPGIEENSVLGLGLSDGVAEFDPLPNVEIELNKIVRSDERDLEGIYRGQKYLNQAFTFDILAQNVSGHRILHIATHGKFEPGVPEDSFLLLGTGERLTIPEINSIGSELKDVHLVVLSACETALGGRMRRGLKLPELVLISSKPDVRVR